MFSNLAQKFTAVKASIYTTEADGDTEDDTHICRVLRSYYTEKGRAFPNWLPPDPKAPPPAIIVQQPVAGGRGYGGMGQQAGGLSSLFDAPQGGRGGGTGYDGQQGGGFQNQSSGSLRGNRSQQQQQQQQPQRHNPFASSNPRQQQQETLQVQARPLPSQRAGSQQSINSSFGRPDSAQGGGGMMSAKDKLKMGFGQKRTASPALSEGGGQQGYNSRGSGGGRDEYQAGGGGSRGYNQQPAAQQGYNDSGRGGGGYQNDNYGGGASGGGGYERGGGERPFVASNAPWATNEMEFSGGGYDANDRGGQAGGGYDNRRQGLPSGPSSGRRGPGLPSGPRAPRY